MLAVLHPGIQIATAAMELLAQCISARIPAAFATAIRDMQQIAAPAPLAIASSGIGGTG